MAERGRWSDEGLPELYGASEAAEALDTTTSNLPRFDLPEPLYVLKAGRFWRADEVRALAHTLGRGHARGRRPRRLPV